MAIRVFTTAAFACLIFLANNCEILADNVWGQGTFDDGQITDANNQTFNTISIMDAGIIEDITVTIEGIEHTNVGDLIAELRFIGNGGPSGPGGEPAFLFFRPNVDVGNTLGSRSNLNGDYTFTSNPNDANFWSESSIPDDETVSDQQDYFASNSNGDYHDLGGPEFFQAFNTVGDWQLIITDANAFGFNEGSVIGWTIEFETVPVPEPAAAVMLLFGAAAFVTRRRRK